MELQLNNYQRNPIHTLPDTDNPIEKSLNERIKRISKHNHHKMPKQQHKY